MVQYCCNDTHTYMFQLVLHIHIISITEIDIYPPILNSMLKYIFSIDIDVMFFMFC